MSFNQRKKTSKFNIQIDGFEIIWSKIFSHQSRLLETSNWISRRCREDDKHWRISENHRVEWMLMFNATPAITRGKTNFQCQVRVGSKTISIIKKKHQTSQNKPNLEFYDFCCSFEMEILECFRVFSEFRRREVNGFGLSNEWRRNKRPPSTCECYSSQLFNLMMWNDNSVRSSIRRVQTMWV